MGLYNSKNYDLTLDLEKSASEIPQTEIKSRSTSERKRRKGKALKRHGSFSIENSIETTRPPRTSYTYNYVGEVKKELTRQKQIEENNKIKQQIEEKKRLRTSSTVSETPPANSGDADDFKITDYSKSWESNQGVSTVANDAKTIEINEKSKEIDDKSKEIETKGQAKILTMVYTNNSGENLSFTESRNEVAIVNKENNKGESSIEKSNVEKQFSQQKTIHAKEMPTIEQKQDTSHQQPLTIQQPIKQKVIFEVNYSSPRKRYHAPPIPQKPPVPQKPHYQHSNSLPALPSKNELVLVYTSPKSNTIDVPVRYDNKKKKANKKKIVRFSESTKQT